MTCTRSLATSDTRRDSGPGPGRVLRLSRSNPLRSRPCEARGLTSERRDAYGVKARNSTRTVPFAHGGCAPRSTTTGIRPARVVTNHCGPDSCVTPTERHGEMSLGEIRAGIVQGVALVPGLEIATAAGKVYECVSLLGPLLIGHTNLDGVSDLMMGLSGLGLRLEQMKEDVSALAGDFERVLNALP